MNAKSLQSPFARLFGTWLVLASLFFVGILHWAIFFQLGNLPFVGLDNWPEEQYHYSVLRASLTQRVIPYFVSPTRRDSRNVTFRGSSTGPRPSNPQLGDLFYETDTNVTYVFVELEWQRSDRQSVKFLGNPRTVLSPQIVLLPLVGLGNFVLFNTWIMYSLGFVGCLLLRKRFQLSLLSFIFLFLLFNFNGHITAHLSVGHTMWLGYFLLPFFFLIILDLAQHQGPPRLRVSLPLSLILFGIVLQGSIHFYIWCLLFLAIFGIFNRRHWKVASLTIVLSLCLSAVRWLPAPFVWGGYIRAGYYSEYTFSTFVDGLTTIYTYGELPGYRVAPAPPGPTGWWEFDAFIGIIGVAFIAYFGIYRRFHGNPDLDRHRFQALDFPILIFVLISFGVGYDLVRDLQVPLLSTVERVPARLFIIPLVALVVISSIRMQSFLDIIDKNTTFKLVSLAAIVLMAYQLGSHSWFWKVKTSGELVGVAVNEFTFNTASQGDLLYTAAVKVGGLVTLIAIVGIAAFFLWTIAVRRTVGVRDSDVGSG